MKQSRLERHRRVISVLAIVTGGIAGILIYFFEADSRGLLSLLGHAATGLLLGYTISKLANVTFRVPTSDEGEEVVD